MEDRHTIEEAVFELSFGSASEALEQEGDLGLLMQRGLLPVVDAVFDEVSSSREGHINTLCVDLGVIAYKGFEREMASRLRVRLKAALEAQLQPIRSASEPGSRASVDPDRKVSAKRSEREDLESFLTDGLVSAPSESAKGGSIDPWVQRVLRLEGIPFAFFLKRSRHKRTVVKRLVYQCSDETLQKIMALLGPAYGRFRKDLVDLITATLRDSPLVKIGEAGLPSLIWESIFHYFLKPEVGTFDADTLADQILKKCRVLPERGNEKQRHDLGHRLKSLFHGAEAQSEKKTRADRIEENTKGHEQSKRAQDSAGEDLNALALLSSMEIRSLLTEAFELGDPEAIRGIWPRLYRKHAQLIEEVFWRSGRRVLVRRGVAQGFPEAMLRDIVHLVEPAGAKFILAFVGQSAGFRRMHSEQALENDALRRPLWEWTFSYLLVERGLPFNKTDYLGSLMTQIATQRQNPLRDLLRTVREDFEKAPSAPIKNEILQALNDLYDALPEPTARRIADSEAQSRAVTTIRGFGLYEKLRQYLLPGDFKYEKRVGHAPAHENDIVQIIDDLSRKHPEQLLKLYRELQFGTALWPQTGGDLPSSVLHRLVLSMLTLNPLENAKPSDLLQAVQQYDKGASDRQVYYRKIFEALLQNRVIDFEAILQKASVSPTQALVANTEKNRLRNADTMGPEPAEISNLIQKVRDTIARGRPEEIEAIWSALLHDHPARLKAVFLQQGREAFVRKKISREFPEAMLYDIVSLIDPAASPFVFEVVSQPRFFQQGEHGPRPPLEAMKAVLWEVTLAYLFVNRGSRFNKKVYLGSVIRQVAAHRNLNPKALLLSLTEGLAHVESQELVSREILKMLRALSEDAGSPRTETQPEIPNLASSPSGDLLHGLEPKPLPSSDSRNVVSEKKTDTAFVSLDALSRLEPRELLKYFRDRSSSAPRADLTLGFPTEALMRFVEAFLSIESEAGKDGKRELADAIAIYAERVADQQGYYSDLFECLAHDRPIDFEMIVQANRPRVEAPPPADAEHSAINTAGETWSHEDSSHIVKRKDPLAVVSGNERPSLKHEMPLEQAFEQLLEPSGPLSAGIKDRLSGMIEGLLLRNPKALSERLLRSLQDQGTIETLVARLPEAQLARLLLLLHPSGFDRLMRVADAIGTACCTPEGRVDPLRLREWKWTFIFRYLFEEGRPFRLPSFVRLFTQYLAEETRTHHVAAFRARLSQALVLNILPSTKEGILEIVSALSKLVEEKASPDSKAMQDVLVEALEPIHPEEPKPIEEVYLYNAGMVLAAPYLQRLFGLLNLTEQSAFKDRSAAERGVHLLEYLVNESCDSPEYRLVLNKILCGVKPGRPIARRIAMQESEKTAIEQLLQGMIAHWTLLGNTSVRGLRESFLQREGKLQLRKEGWRLTVQPKPYDMLLDQIPWAYSMIRLPWMEQTVYVKWRES